MSKNVSLENEGLNIPYFLSEKRLYNDSFVGSTSIASTRMYKNNKKSMKLYVKIIPIAKSAMSLILICSILFALGQWEHPDTSASTRFVTCMMQGCFGYILYRVLRDNWDEIKSDIKCMMELKDCN